MNELVRLPGDQIRLADRDRRKGPRPSDRWLRELGIAPVDLSRVHRPGRL